MSNLCTHALWYGAAPFAAYYEYALSTSTVTETSLNKHAGVA